MPRAPLGDAARTEIIAVRVTRAQKAALTELFGNPASGILAWVRTVTKGK